MGEVRAGDYTVPFGKAAIAREGKDISIIALGSMLKPALGAAQLLAKEQFGAEVIDPRTFVPLDENGLCDSVRKTGFAVIVDEARDRCSGASHIAAVLADKAFGHLKGPVKRVTVPNVCLPYAPAAESRLIPNAAGIAAACRALLTGNR